MTSKQRAKLFCGAAAFILAASAGALNAAETVHWSYHGSDGPDAWGTLLDSNGNIAFPTCGLGESQSPIDIAGQEDGDDLEEIEFHYEPTPLVVKNNGHTIEVEYESGSSVTIDNDTYNLLQFHFHTPSEHEVSGNSFPMEMHLVHAGSVGDNVELAVVGLLIDLGSEDNATLQGIWDVMPDEEGVVHVDGATIDATDLLPDFDDNKYFAYSGSLTTPPCTEGVRWMVMKQEIDASLAQVSRFQEIFDMNARPTQPLFGRPVFESDDF